MMTLVALVMIVGAGACDKAELTGAKAEVKKTDVKLDLPAVPNFDIPTTGGDARGVRELRVMGRKLLDTQVTVKGYVTWKYDCVVAGGPGGPIGGPEATPEERQKLIDDDPMLCWRPHFYLGDTPDTPPHQSLWVVEVAPMRTEVSSVLRRTQASASRAIGCPVVCDSARNFSTRAKFLSEK